MQPVSGCLYTRRDDHQGSRGMSGGGSGTGEDLSAELFGPPLLKAIKGPLPYAELLPTGGVSVDNLGEWFQAGAAAVGVGR